MLIRPMTVRAPRRFLEEKGRGIQGQRGQT